MGVGSGIRNHVRFTPRKGTCRFLIKYSMSHQAVEERGISKVQLGTRQLLWAQILGWEAPCGYKNTVRPHVFLTRSVPFR